MNNLEKRTMIIWIILIKMNIFKDINIIGQNMVLLMIIYNLIF